METSALSGSLVRLRAATHDDVATLARIRSIPEVYQRWGGGDDLLGDVSEGLTDSDVRLLVILYEDRVVGAIQWSEEDDPDYRHAGIDIYLDPAVHGQGLGSDAVRTLARTSSTRSATTAW